MVKITIDTKEMEVDEGLTILEASHKAQVRIPTLCYLKDINEIGACRICVVEIEGREDLVASCVTKVEDGMIIHTNSPRVRESRKTNLELLLSDHDLDCLSCSKSLDCRLQQLAKEYECDSKKYEGAKSNALYDDSGFFIRDNSKCIKCKRCVAICREKQSVFALCEHNKGFENYIGCVLDKSLSESSCVYCGQCLLNCPTGALRDKSQKDEILENLSNKKKRMIVAMAPSARVALGEAFGSKIGENVEGKMITALRRLGFDDVFDVDFGADLTIMEEANEFITRLEANTRLPLMTSCCPAWVKFVEEFFPEFIPNLSNAKSPQQMLSATIKTFYAKRLGVKPEDLYFVSVMPCIAKKYERVRDSMSCDGKHFDTDAVITERELVNIIKTSGLDFMKLEDGKFDEILGMASGSGAIFGATGGVMEAALRTVGDRLEKKSLTNVEYLLVRGQSGIKEAQIELAGRKINVAVVSGLKNARELLTKIKNKEKTYDFIEVMACPGGCANGGGMPIHPTYVIRNENIAKLRAENLYKSDLKNSVRKSHENPSIKLVYKEFFGFPGSEIANKYLHQTFKNKSQNLQK